MGLLTKAAGKSEPPVRAFLDEFKKTNISFHCAVLKADTQAVCGMASSIGKAADLGNGNCLVLFPLSIDRELAVHRLAKSLGAEILCQCEANSSDTALAAITSCL